MMTSTSLPFYAKAAPSSSGLRPLSADEVGAVAGGLGLDDFQDKLLPILPILPNDPPGGLIG